MRSDVGKIINNITESIVRYIHTPDWQLKNDSEAKLWHDTWENGGVFINLGDCRINIISGGEYIEVHYGNRIILKLHHPRLKYQPLDFWEEKPKLQEIDSTKNNYGKVFQWHGKDNYLTYYIYKIYVDFNELGRLIMLSQQLATMVAELVEVFQQRYDLKQVTTEMDNDDFEKELNNACNIVSDIEQEYGI